MLETLASSSPWWLDRSQRTGPTSLLAQMVNRFKAFSLKKINIATQKIGFCGGRWPSFPISRRIRLGDWSHWSGPTNLWLKRILRCAGGYLQRQMDRLAWSTMLCGMPFYRVVSLSQWGWIDALARSCWELSDCVKCRYVEKWREWPILA